MVTVNSTGAPCTQRIIPILLGKGRDISSTTLLVIWGASVISAFHGSNVSWRGEISLDTNFAGLYGGGVFLVYGSILSWSGKGRFCDNMAGVDGGAMVVYDHRRFR